MSSSGGQGGGGGSSYIGGLSNVDHNPSIRSRSNGNGGIVEIEASGFQVSIDEAPDTVSAGDILSVDVTLTNNSLSDWQTVTISFAGEESSTTERVQADSTSSTSLSVQVPEDHPEGSTRVTVSTDGDSDSAWVEVEVGYDIDLPEGEVSEITVDGEPIDSLSIDGDEL